jgi:hypothetical protein
MVNDQTETFFKKVSEFLKNEFASYYNFKDLFIFILAVGIALAAFLKVSDHTSATTIKTGSFVLFICLLIGSTRDVQQTIARHVNLICPLTKKVLASSGELFRIQFETKGEIVFSFVYYYVLTYVKFFILTIILFVCFFFFYILLHRQLKYFEWKHTQSIMDTMSDGLTELQNVVDPRGMKHVDWFFGSFEFIFRYLPEKLGDVFCWRIFFKPLFKNFHPNEYIDFFSLKDTFEAKLHLFIFFAGLAISFIYGYVFIHQSKGICKSNETQNRLKSEMQQGHFLVMGVIIFVYLGYFLYKIKSIFVPE